MFRRRLSPASEEVKKIIRSPRDRIKLPTINKATFTYVQIRSEEVSNMYKTTVKFCILLHVTSGQ